MDNERQFKGIWIPKEIWLDENLSILEKHLLVEIDSLETEDRGCYANNKYFADFFKLTSCRISQLIQGLKTKGYIKIEYKIEKKEVKERNIFIEEGVFNKLKGGIKKIKGGYLENFKDNNINTNNTNNKDIVGLDKISEIVDYLNNKIGTNYKPTTSKTQSCIKARMNEGYKFDDFKKVIDIKYQEWNNTKMQNFLRPETLFGNKFESYLNQKSEIVIQKTKRELEKDEIERLRKKYENE